jgi:transglutaminase-like putative cysteine protease
VASACLPPIFRATSAQFRRLAKKRLEGADAMHAWVSLWCGKSHGWVGLDPTNAMVIGNDHIVLAKGRDYADISPVAGIVLGSREQDVDVRVDVVPRV